jgi:ribosomal protein S18 acetylase RimI-like enzyme
VVLRPGGPVDATAVATLHAQQIAEGFLASLGPRFLTHLYRRVAVDPSSFLVVADGGGGACGFIAGSVDVGALYRSFLRHDALPAAASALPRLARHWRFALQTLRHGSDGPAGPELLSVAVDPSQRGRGVGARLVTAFQEELGRRQLPQAHVVVGATNEPAQALYRGAGFEEERRFELHPGTTSVIMTWTGGSGPGHPGPGATSGGGRP